LTRNHTPSGTGASDDRTTSPLRWGVLALAAIAIFCSYYESDAIGPIADLLGRQRGFTQSQIGDLTAVISLPNILLAVFNGLLIDRYGPARVTLWAAVIGFVGAVLTAIGTPYELMWTGRLVFGVSGGCDIHLPHRRCCAMVLTQRHCARHGDIPVSCPGWIVFARHLTFLGAISVRCGLAAALMAGRGNHRCRPRCSRRLSPV
jgi:MFS family permease